MSKKSSKPTKSSKPFTSPKSIIVDESIYPEIEEQITQETVDFGLAKKLTGRPQTFGLDLKPKLERLVVEGIAADFGSEGYARGYAWRLKVLKRS
jgi:hypothetical protein